MGIKFLITPSKWQKFILAVMLLSYFSCSLAFCQSASDSITFTKKEIAVFNWGDGPQEIGTTGETDTQSHKKIDKKSGEVISGLSDSKVTKVFPQIEMNIDGEDNVYFYDSVHSRIFVVTMDGKVGRVIDANVYDMFWVDETGDVFYSHLEKNMTVGLTCVKPDGEELNYQDFRLGKVVNGVAYEMYGNKAITIIANKDNDAPDKLPPRLSGGILDGGDFRIDRQNNVVFIHTEKINKHLKKINLHIDSNEIRIKIPQKSNLTSWPKILGVDDSRNIYVLCSYKTDIGWHTHTVEFYLDVYSFAGKMLSRTTLSGIGQNENNFAIDIHGNVIQVLRSNDGVHIIEWLKS